MAGRLRVRRGRPRPPGGGAAYRVEPGVPGDDPHSFGWEPGVIRPSGVMPRGQNRTGLSRPVRLLCQRPHGHHRHDPPHGTGARRARSRSATVWQTRRSPARSAAPRPANGLGARIITSAVFLRRRHRAAVPRPPRTAARTPAGPQGCGRRAGRAAAAPPAAPASAGTWTRRSPPSRGSGSSGGRIGSGDVRGHGLDALRTVAAVLGSVREAAHDEPGLHRVPRRPERAQARHPRERAHPQHPSNSAPETTTRAPFRCRRNRRPVPAATCCPASSPSVHGRRAGRERRPSRFLCLPAVLREAVRRHPVTEQTLLRTVFTALLDHADGTPADDVALLVPRNERRPTAWSPPAEPPLFEGEPAARPGLLRGTPVNPPTTLRDSAHTPRMRALGSHPV